MTPQHELALAPAGTGRPRTPVEPQLAKARTVGALIADAAPAIEAEGRLPAPVLAAMHDAGLFRLSLPAYLHGAELPLAELARIAETIAEADASAGWCLGQALGCATAAAFLDRGVAEEIFGPSDAVLAWGAGAVGTAVPVEGGYRISGTWRFASGGDHATWLGGHCQVREPDGSPRTNAAGRQVNRTALFPRGSATVHDDWHVMGLRGTRSEGYTVEDLFVEDAFTLNRDAQAERRSDATLFRFPVLHVYSSVFAGVAAGNARAALDLVTELARSKTARGAPTSMRDSPVVQTRVAELEARLNAACAYRGQVLADVWERVAASGQITPAERAPLRLATTHGIHEATRVAEQAYRMAGATAIFTGHRFEQRLRDAYAISQQVQGRYENYELVGRHLLGLPVDSIFF